MTKYIVEILSVLAVSLMIAAALAIEAKGHTPDPRACKIAWEQAEVGTKWQAMQQCRKMQAQHRRDHICAAKRPMLRNITVKRVRATKSQRAVLHRALTEARRMRVPRSHMVGLVMGITQESGAVNINWGHGSSIGVLQLIDIHGSVAWRLNIANSVGWFLRGARKLDPHGRARLKTTSSGYGLVQRVQRSGHPYAYNQWHAEAQRTVRRFLGPCPR